MILKFCFPFSKDFSDIIFSAHSSYVKNHTFYSSSYLLVHKGEVLMAYAPINQSTYLFCDLKYQFNAIEEAFMYLRKFPSYFCYQAVNFENLEISNDMNVERPGNVGYFNQSCEQHVRNKCFSECCTKMSAVSGIFRFQRKCLLIRFSEEHLSHVLNLGNVAVHCHAGLGRTGVVIASYLVWRYHLSADEAINYVRKKR